MYQKKAWYSLFKDLTLGNIILFKIFKYTILLNRLLHIHFIKLINNGWVLGSVSKIAIFLLYYNNPILLQCTPERVN